MNYNERTTGRRGRKKQKKIELINAKIWQKIAVLHTRSGIS